MVYWLTVIPIMFLVVLLMNVVIGYYFLKVRDKSYWVASTVMSFVGTIIFVSIL
ncbi:hypothetical protein [Planococcus versutus]|uniref:hypothetical protein n=1 Tax=Planococcus versutus TaxID=1302659 RepID=UPI00194F8084|nr:hypothetical protein [Planococcus versutus]